MSSAAEPAPENVRQELTAICAHTAFMRSARLRQFLSFIVEQTLNSENVNEQLVGVNVFRRKPGFDTGNQTIVRTEAVELRKRLEQYYTDNPKARVKISVPRGTYKPKFEWIDQVAVSCQRPEPVLGGVARQKGSRFSAISRRPVLAISAALISYLSGSYKFVDRSRNILVASRHPAISTRKKKSDNLSWE